jgi:hypothetical protein
MSIEISSYNPTSNKWNLVIELTSNSRPATVSNVLPNGKTEIIVLSCGETESTVSKFTPTHVIRTSDSRLVDPKDVETAEEIAVLSHGKSMEISVRTEKQKLRMLRFAWIGNY